MIKPVEAKPGAGMTYDTSLSPAPAPTSPSESVAAPAEVGQVMGTTEFVISQILFPFFMLVGLGLCAFVNLYFLGGVLRFLLEQCV